MKGIDEAMSFWLR